LLPEENGEVGQVLMATEASSRVIDQPYGSAQAGSMASEEIKLLSKEEVEQKYGAVLAAHPKPPQSFTFYFVNDSDQLTEQSMSSIKTVVAAVKERLPVVTVNIVGHTDALGSKEYNMQLSRQRAKAVAGLLTDAAISPEILHLHFFGENDPMVPAPDNVAEPRNRRVEVMVL
jgi:outer membrane protein OmpA-like peptidoglycan-associated protein